MFVCNLTQYSQHSVVLKHFHGARADKVYSLQSVTLANKELPGSTERSFDDERQRAQTPSTGRFKQRQLKQLFIQVHGNVSPQFIWEVLQKLGNDKDILSTLSILVILKNIFFFYVWLSKKQLQQRNCRSVFFLDFNGILHWISKQREWVMSYVTSVFNWTH